MPLLNVLLSRPILSSAVLFFLLPTAAFSGNVLPNGDFQKLDAQGRPESWQWANPDSLRIVEEHAGYSAMSERSESKGANRHLRVTQTEPGPHVFAEQLLPVQPDWISVKIRLRMRAKNLVPGTHKDGYQNGRLQFRFEDEKGEMVGGWPTVPFLDRDSDWMWQERNYQIPPGAKFLKLQAAIMAATGTVDFDDISVVPVLAGDLPPGERITWGEEPVEELTSKRGRICLNGIWRFRPVAAEEKGEPASKAWGAIRVPGDWTGYGGRPTILTRGIGIEWRNFNGNETAKAWYRREIEVPESWEGRAIILELERVSTDALIYVDGKKCGTVNWPYGFVDITKEVKPGQKAILDILAVAVQDEEKVRVFMGPGQVSEKEAKLNSRGLTGDVILHSRPKGGHIDSVFVRTSTRKKSIALDVELADVRKAGEISFRADMLDERGVVEKSFKAISRVRRAKRQTIQLEWNWRDPRFWDLGEPNLYTLKLNAAGRGIEDEYAQPFGFREFWIEGRRFILNGTEIRLRPVHSHAEAEWWSALGTPKAVDAAYDGCMWVGYNIMEIWPWDHYERGTVHWRDIWYERADKKGFLLMGTALSASDAAALWKQPNWLTPGLKEEWERRMKEEMRRYRNHPSVVIWATSPNFFGHGDDQNPRRIGNKTVGRMDDEGWRRSEAIGEEVVALIKNADPTRPVLVHQGGPVGEIYALNSYLNMIPLQEREEWLSEWAKSGDMPYTVIEGGTPLHCTFMRKRNGGGWGSGDGASYSEPLMTEFCAIYLGREAYELETEAYVRDVSDLFIEGTFWKNWQGSYTLDQAPANQEIQRLFGTNSFRSWRTQGMTGGFVPWSDGHGWSYRKAEYDELVDTGPFVPGTQGTYRRMLPRYLLHYLKPAGSTIHPGGKAIVENNQATLAYIAGRPGAFTAKDHNFIPGQQVRKQIAIINDTREACDYRAEYRVKVGGRSAGKGTASGSIKPAETKLLDLDFAIPGGLKGAKTPGSIELNVRMGKAGDGVAEAIHKDVFDFRVFRELATPGRELQVFDPAGMTSRMLERLGYRLSASGPWKKDTVLVIGREAFSKGHTLSQDLEAFVRAGGRAVVFAQHPDWLKDYLGFRVAAHLSRRVFPVENGHPALRGLDAEDMRDWAGESTLVEPYPDYINREVRRGMHGSPWFGWHWGNRGSVATCAIEKPHHSGWRPILECEFDLAYTPLMELDYGKGRLIWLCLDLEGRQSVSGEDPAGRPLARRIIEYAATAPLSPRSGLTVFVGEDREGKFLDSMGLEYERREKFDPGADLAILGSAASPGNSALKSFLRKGGQLLIMKDSPAADTLGASFKEVPEFRGSLQVPGWPEVRGLSSSDLRWRAFHPARLLAGGSGIEIGAQGMLGRIKLGQGTAILAQIDPEMFGADEKTYFRYTRWRATRTLSQLLANLGASFRMDSRIFTPRSAKADSIALNGPWKVRMIEARKAARNMKKTISDPGISKEAESLVGRELDDSEWEEIELPGLWEEFIERDGEAVFRKEIQVPAHLAGKDLMLHLGAVDDFDSTFFNGRLVGSTDRSVEQHWAHPRVYAVPGELVIEGRNAIAVRVFDNYGGGGLSGPHDEMALKLKETGPVLGFYHVDYWEDYAAGDDPYRYERW